MGLGSGHFPARLGVLRITWSRFLSDQVQQRVLLARLHSFQVGWLNPILEEACDVKDVGCMAVHTDQTDPAAGQGLEIAKSLHRSLRMSRTNSSAAIPTPLGLLERCHSVLLGKGLTARTTRIRG